MAVTQRKITSKLTQSSVNVAFHSLEFLKSVEEVTDTNWKNLEEWIRSNQANGENKIKEMGEPLLLQVEHALNILHSKQIFHGSLEPSSILLLRGKSHITISHADEDNNKTKPDEIEAAINRDISALADLYCYVLTGGHTIEYHGNITTGDLIACPDPEIALHSIVQMKTRQGINISDVLRHPFHWSNAEKINYMMETHQKFDLGKTKREKGIEYRRACEFFNENADESLTNWAVRCKLNEEELENIRERIEQSEENLTVNEVTIYDLIPPKYKPNKKSEHTFDLLKFFRNRYVHFDEENKKVQLCFGGKSGFWNFFSSKFPKLFMHIFSRMVDHDARNKILPLVPDGIPYLKSIPLPE